MITKILPVSKYWPLLVAGGLAACQLSATETSQGRSYFVGYGCIRCHRVAGEGGAYGPDLTFIGFRKSRPWLDLWLKNPHNWKHNTVMPNFHLPDPARTALLEYLTSLKGEGYRQTPPWNSPGLMSDSIHRGKEIFDRVGCVGCHGHNGVGGYPNNNVAGNKIPSLTRVADGFSKEELKTRIRAGSKPLKDDPSGLEPMILMPVWGEVLKDDEIDAVADYLLSLKPKTSSSSGEEW